MVLCAILVLWARTHYYGESFIRGVIWNDGGTVYTKWQSVNSFDGRLWVYRGREQRRERSERTSESNGPRVEYVHRRFVLGAPVQTTYELDVHGFGYSVTLAPQSREVTGAGLILPHWFAALVAALLPCVWARWLFVRFRRYDRITRGRCPDCGYDLRESPERCPECGMLVGGAGAGPLPIGRP
jgi:hypothetical protein